MDPLVQGLLGASASLSVSRPKDSRAAFWLGLLGGLAPDLDVLIRSNSDPLLALQYHRHFTHSLVFIPAGGFFVAALVYPFVRQLVGFRKAWLFATLGWATHGLLDACTNYGTQLLWPFSNLRVAWNNVAIVDPVVTIALVVGVWKALRTQSMVWARRGGAVVLVYLAFGVLQHARAVRALDKAALAQGHVPTRLTAKPTVLNNILFRGLYEFQGNYYVAAVRAPWFGSSQVSRFSSVPALDLERDLPELPTGSLQRRDLERFAWFSDGFLNRHPADPFLIGDLRFSMLPDDIAPMWAVRIDPSRPMEHVGYETFSGRATSETWNRFVALLKGPLFP